MRHATFLLALIALGSTPIYSQTAPNPLGATQPAPLKAPQNPSQLFKQTTVWNLHLKFTAVQWDAMDPKGNGFEHGGATRMGADELAAALASALMKAGDLNHDGILSKDEFSGVGEKWFRDWDIAKTGALRSEQIRTGMSLATGLTDSRLQGPPGARNGLASAAGIEFVYVHADLEFQGQTIKDVGVRYKGNGTWMNQPGNKHSMKVDINHFKHLQKFAGIAKLNLHNNIIDPSFMNEVLSHKLYRDAGVPAPRTAYARVYVTVGGGASMSISGSTQSSRILTGISKKRF